MIPDERARVQRKLILSALLTSRIKFSTHEATIKKRIHDVNQRLKHEGITPILVPDTFNFRLILPTIHFSLENVQKKK